MTWDKESIVSGISDGRQIVDEFSDEMTGPDDLFYSYIFDDESDADDMTNEETDPRWDELKKLIDNN